MNKMLRQGFSTFLRRRRAQGHFERRPLLASLTAAALVAREGGAGVPSPGQALLAANFGNVLSVLVASAFLPFLPMLPLQLLVQNLLYDIGQTGIPFDNVDPELVAKPLKWNPSDIGRFMLFFGPVSSFFDIITFAVMWWVFDANSLARQALFQSGWFVVGLLTQTLVVHMLRTPRLPFVQSRAAPPLMAMTLAIMAVGLWLPLGPMAGYFRLQALPAAYYFWLVAILLGYCLLTTVMKRVYIRRFGWQ